jgi:hypothetical protein
MSTYGHRLTFAVVLLGMLLLGLNRPVDAGLLHPDLALQAAATAWSDLHYVFVTGSSFTPRGSSTTWSYAGVGCVSVASGTALFTVPLHLPEGSHIDYLRLYYRDTSASNSIAWITNYDAAGAFTDLTTVSSSGDSGYGTTLSPYVGHVVDNASRAYTLNWQANETGTGMQLCGLRVAYRMPLSQVFMPLAVRG